MILSSNRELNRAENRYGKKVLLIEDDPYWQFMVGESLRSADETVQVRCVRSVKQAEYELYNHASGFDLIIADHFLDGRATGLDLWRKCQSDQSAIPFVMLSGMSRDDLRDLMESDEISPLLLEKPFDIRKLQKVLDGRLPATRPCVDTIRNRRFKGGLAAILLFFVLGKGLWPSQVGTSITNQQSQHAEKRETVAISTTHIGPPLSDTGVHQRPTKRKFDVQKIVTPALKKKIAAIVARVDEINRTIEIIK